MAPEVLVRRRYGTPVDVFSVGAVFYFVLCGTPPCCSGSATLHSALLETITSEVKFDGRFKRVGATHRLAILSMMKRDAGARPTASYALKQEPFTKPSLLEPLIESADEHDSDEENELIFFVVFGPL
eukprot:TRINITY_DN20266_c0_g1_i1.p3 TRINITY_DN20266_c0_g1~~TRINITY_DN20266_c0_g1_i1.p3  ORF type:complete len:127 (+),score=15.91 TRINITY_DN20266_c0_g1_i1:582-962(+)